MEYEVIVSVPEEMYSRFTKDVKITRCKDCKYKCETEDGEWNPEDVVCSYWDTDGLEENDFCSYAERKEENGRQKNA